MDGDELSNIETQVLEASELAVGLPPGTVLFGAYEILGLLGSGGMGEVYRARHLRLGGMRAIKVLHPNMITQPDLLERFYREARALLQVHHEAVVRCHDLLEDEQRAYLVMELVDGIPLLELLREGPLSEQQVRKLGTRLASGLASAHAAGVVHRDLSPDNVMLPEGRPELAKIIDFGIATVRESSFKTVADGMFMGKLSYASPEQFGLYGGEVDQRSDLYSLGLLLSAAALGRPLDMGHKIADSVSARTLRIELPSSVPKGLRAGIEALLIADPRGRPSSATDFLEIWTNPPALAGASSKSRLKLVLLLATLLGFAAVTIGLYIGRDPTGPPTEIRSDRAALESASFESLREWLLTAPGSAAELRPRLRTVPDPVPDGTTYVVSLQANCDCSALVFEIDGSQDRISLLYPNPYELAEPLTAGRTLDLPTSQAYSLEAEKGVGTDRLKLIVVDGVLDFPPPGFSQWEVTPEQSNRRAELAQLIEVLGDRRWAGVAAPLRIVR
jgi:serine/threonine protein kinase